MITILPTRLPKNFRNNSTDNNSQNHSNQFRLKLRPDQPSIIILIKMKTQARNVLFNKIPSQSPNFNIIISWEVKSAQKINYPKTDHKYTRV